MSTEVERRLWEQLKEERAASRRLLSELKPYRKAADAAERFARAVNTAKPPPWLLKPGKAAAHGPGVPLLHLSDLHMNEYVHARDVAGRNRFSPSIALTRLERTFQTAIDLALNHMVTPSGWTYPGFVVVLNGDLLDNLLGNYHRSERHSDPIADAVASTTNALAVGIARLADIFGDVLVICVPGNHGRTTEKMPSEYPAGSNLDTIVYNNLKVHRLLAGKRVTVLVAPGTELRFKVYGTSFVATHGYQWRGGDGEIGSLGPVTRGVKRLRAAYSQLNLDVDVVLVGHFHQYFPGVDFRMNGSLKGYDAVAMKNKYPYQPPIQDFFFVHPEWGITAQWPIYVDGRKPHPDKRWALVEAA